MPSEQIVNRIPNRLRAIISGSIGNLVEWYDWYAYSAFSLYFAPVFFPESNATIQLLNTAAIFAAGFLVRPLGGWLFGMLADRKGRKLSMTLSVLLMSAGSMFIAFTPSYSSIGVMAPVILLAARLLQGLSVGGEYGTSATYLSEMATTERKGFYSSFQYVTLIGGQLIALGLQLLMLRLFLTDAQMHNWGWRVPFIIGAVLSLVALYLRSQMEETPAYMERSSIKVASDGSIKQLMKYPRQIAIVVGLTAGGTVAFYTYTTYMQKFLVNTVHLEKRDAASLTFISLLIYACLQPLFGALSDRIGRKPLLIGFGVCGTLATYPLLTALSSCKTKTEAFIYMMTALIIVSGYTSINAIVKAELFPTKIRALGVGFPYAVTVAVFGGTAEFIALSFKNASHENWYYVYVTACIFTSLVVYLFMRETKNNSLESD